MEFVDTDIPTIIPTKVVGPINVVYKHIAESIYVPLATFETPLWYSLKRGALISQKCGGIKVFVSNDCMTRSVIFEGIDTETVLKCQKWLTAHYIDIEQLTQKSSRFAKLVDIHSENVGRLLYVRLSVETGNASGHNMVTKIADELAEFTVAHCAGVRYISVSGNYCVDKKVSAVNSILGRGKRATAEITIPKKLCESVLKTTPQAICELNTKKNLVGSVLAGSTRSANAHYANILLAIYLATGQDAANIVEGSQGITSADIHEEDLYFSVTLPNIIVGTVGNGKNLEFASSNLEMMNCFANDAESAKRLAAVIAAAVLCSELSLMAAQTNPGELMRTHISLERKR